MMSLNGRIPDSNKTVKFKHVYPYVIVRFQITPIYALSSNLNWFNFLTLYESLPPAHRRVADLVGVDEGFLTRLASSGGLKSTHRLSEMRERQLNIHTR